MAITAKEVAQLRQYAEGVMERADHHAGNVRGAAFTALGGINWCVHSDTIRSHDAVRVFKPVLQRQYL